ncbi:MAG TPA: glucose 1-dehydrogenase [Chthoniobacterales bacterium]|jgi:NAD(P)-dependent dehydrogenase (short-subunit alcohol dehydrogenase family)|nr:glucose 1-dehydrogenase [Chthoniobacterales bacterium]
MGAFAGKVALITGAGNGIGRASAMVFAREGAKVVVADVIVEAGEQTAKLIQEGGGDAIFVAVDVSDADQVSALVAKTVSTYGRLDVAHNNAGIEGPIARIADCPESEWDRTIEINLKGVWLCMKYEIPVMLKLGRGAIVNTASVAGLAGVSQLAAYTASKHGVVGLTKAAALEYRRFGIRVNAVCPGLIQTAMIERAADTKLGRDLPTHWRPLGPVLKAMQKLGIRAIAPSQKAARRLGEPGEVAEAVVWLCSDAASFTTGHAMVIDGGYLAK